MNDLKGITFDELGNPTFDDYRLKLWSALVRVRDERICQLCLNYFDGKTELLQAHHIFPKIDHPELAYSLAQSCALCIKCHLRITHSDERNVRRFRVMFYAHANTRYVKEFNMRYQHKVGDIHLPTKEDLEKYKISKGWSELMLDAARGYKLT